MSSWNRGTPIVVQSLKLDFQMETLLVDAIKASRENAGANRPYIKLQLC